MGMRGYSVAVGPAPLLVTACMLAGIWGTAGTCEPPQSCCQLPHCWDLYQSAQDSLGVRDDFDPTRPNRLTPQEQVNKCVSLRTFNNCIRNMTRNRGCVGNLNFHSAKKGIEKQMKQLNCSTSGRVFKPSDRPYGRPSHSSVCSYKGKQEYRHCGLFGDPHLRTFFDEFQTCKVQGAWPLVDNDYLTVMVTNDPVGMWEGQATATSKLTVVIKQNSCGPDQYVTYQASTDDLPGSFDDGSTHFGQERSVEIVEEDPNKHIEIYLRYIDTTLIVRQVGRYFTFAMKMPTDVVDHSMNNNRNGIQLCTRGCPPSELIDYHEYLAQKHVRLKAAAEGADVARLAMTRHVAEAKCREALVVDFYYDSCVFDLMTTGDVNFTRAAQQALTDVLRLYPQAAKMHRNRTTLPHAGKPHPSAATSSYVTVQRTSSQSSCYFSSLQRTSQQALLALLAFLLSSWPRDVL